LTINIPGQVVEGEKKAPAADDRFLDIVSGDPGQGGEGEGERVKGKREEGVEPDGDV